MDLSRGNVLHGDENYCGHSMGVSDRTDTDNGLSLLLPRGAASLTPKQEDRLMSATA